MVSDVAEALSKAGIEAMVEAVDDRIVGFAKP